MMESADLGQRNDAAFTDDPAPRAAVAQATAFLREAFSQPDQRAQR
jgi:hypothetical protein